MQLLSDPYLLIEPSARHGCAGLLVILILTFFNPPTCVPHCAALQKLLLRLLLAPHRVNLSPGLALFVSVRPCSSSNAHESKRVLVSVSAFTIAEAVSRHSFQLLTYGLTRHIFFPRHALNGAHFDPRNFGVLR